MAATTCMIKERQSAPAVMMIRPCRVPANPQTAASNAFQQPVSGPVDRLLAQVRAEFESLASSLQQAGVKVLVFDDTPDPVTPDAVFPNNWITTHADGRVALYPMLAPNRRAERRHDLITKLTHDFGYSVTDVVDFSGHERSGMILEGTGSMILDRVNRVAYACVSPRTDPALLKEFCKQFDYESYVFKAVDRAGQEIYHTNVLMAVGTHFATVCGAAIPDRRAREALFSALQTSGHAIVDISFSQLENFAGNMLELEGDGKALIAMSQRAFDSLSAGQRDVLASDATLLSSAIDTIEDCGGGSVRCMLAEIYLPEKDHD